MSYLTKNNRFPILMHDFLRCCRDYAVSTVDRIVTDIEKHPDEFGIGDFPNFGPEEHLDGILSDVLSEPLKDFFGGTRDEKTAEWFAQRVLWVDHEERNLLQRLERLYDDANREEEAA